ncbi:DUF6233 domain-containing protein [Streptomyces sp. NPDC086777]|uniref:DUF6233 domain-containing protein n=1 Tax=Streptomyces sp. NPDC086777 TaxID=3154866 RepID=UPI00344E5843
MNELPPPRLRAILAHLDKQPADTETIATYLRLQRSAVLAALSRGERRAIPRPSVAAPKRPPAPAAPASPRESGRSLPARFIVERPVKPSSGALVHTSACTKGFTSGRPLDAGIARQALVNDPRGFAACTACRPDTELGIDVA